MTTIPHPSAPAQLQACPRCAHPGPHATGPGAGPHTARLVCAQCGAFIKWLSQQTPEARAQKRETSRRQWMEKQPATDRQLFYLQNLGYSGFVPETRLAAHDAIRSCLQHREVEP